MQTIKFSTEHAKRLRELAALIDKDKAALISVDTHFDGSGMTLKLEFVMGPLDVEAMPIFRAAPLPSKQRFHQWELAAAACPGDTTLQYRCRHCGKDITVISWEGNVWTSPLEICPAKGS
jgi:hypothetical protein